jgi:phage protein D
LKTLFVGRIARPEATFPQDGAPSLSIRAYDLSQRFRREEERKARTWQNVTDSQVARQMAASHGFAPTDLDIEETQIVILYVAQGSESDWEFLQRRAERIGFELFVEQARFHFHGPRDGIRMASLRLEYGRNLRNFEPRISLDQQVTKVVVRGWDPEKKVPIVAMATAATTADRAKLGTVSGADFVKTDFGQGVKVLSDLSPRSQKEAEEMAMAYFKRKEFELISATGGCVGDPALKAKTLADVSGVGRKYSGTYYLAKVVHTLDDSGYVCEFEGTRNAVA